MRRAGVKQVGVKQVGVKRVVLKVGSSSLTDADGRIDLAKLSEIAAAVRSAKAAGIEIALVSSGAVAAGAGKLGRARPRTLPEKQAFAAVGQAELMRQWAGVFAPPDVAPIVVAQFLLSSDDIHSRKRFVNAKQALDAAFKLGVLPILNENDTVATAELKLGDNDTLSAWVAYLVDADTLMLLTDVDGLYSANPKTDANAVKLSEVRDISQVMHLAGDAGSARGTGGMRTKLKAAQIASDAGIDTIILTGGGAAVQASLSGATIGTRIFAPRPRTAARPDFAQTRRQTAKRSWILHQPTRGAISIDAGAKTALLAGRSLLPSGITQIEGDFNSGDAVQIRFGDQLLGQGLSSYRAADLQRIAGKRSAEISAILGVKPFDEAIHRDRLVLG